MGRRKSGLEHGLDELRELLLIVPVWFGPCLAVLAFVLLRYAVPAVCSMLNGGGTKNDLGLSLVHTFSTMVAPWTATLVAFVWIVAEVEKLRRRRLFDAQTGPNSIRGLSWQDFELLLGEAYRRQGYVVEVTGRDSADGGIDVVLRRGVELVLVQCKHWKTRFVGVKPVRELLGVVTARRASRGILVTSGDFTEDARHFARNTVIALVDGNDLMQLIDTAQGVQANASTLREEQLSPSGSQPPDSPASDSPNCPKCGATMVVRTVRKGKRAGSLFWGCSTFAQTECGGIREIA